MNKANLKKSLQVGEALLKAESTLFELAHEAKDFEALVGAKEIWGVENLDNERIGSTHITTILDRIHKLRQEFFKHYL